MGIVEGFQAEKIYSSSWRRNIGNKTLFLVWLISVSWVWLFIKKNIQRKISISSRTWKSNTDLISRSSCAHCSHVSSDKPHTYQVLVSSSTSICVSELKRWLCFTLVWRDVKVLYNQESTVQISVIMSLYAQWDCTNKMWLLNKPIKMQRWIGGMCRQS